jgi:MFS family permease
VNDRRLLYAAGFLRSTTIAMTPILLALYLTTVGLSKEEIGTVLGVGLAGGATAVLLSTVAAERIGRRRFLVVLAVLGAAGTAAAAFLDAPLALGVVAFLGMLNGMGRDRGAATALEQALLPSTTDDRGRTFVIARYTLLQDAGCTLGNLATALPVALVALAGMDRLGSLRAALLFCAFLQVPGVLLYARLSPTLSPPAAERPPPVSPESRRVLARLCALFALDAVGGGFLLGAWLTLFFKEQFGASDAAIVLLFTGKSVLNAVSHLGAAWLSRRIGLVNTMVFTHIPGSLLLLTVAYAPSFPVAAILFLLREGLVEMDVPTRQSYVMAVVKPEERTAASGATGLVRLGGWAIGGKVTGLVAAAPGALAIPLVIGAAMKITYDVLLWSSFRRLKPPEER